MNNIYKKNDHVYVRNVTSIYNRILILGKTDLKKNWSHVQVRHTLLLF